MSEDLASHPQLEPVRDAVAARFGPALTGAVFRRGELTLRLAKDELRSALEFLKSELGFDTLEDIVGLDSSGPAPTGPRRFSVLYLLRRAPGPLRLRVEVEAAEDESLPSAVPVFRSANWAEREIFDMFGVRFEGHPDLRRIYLDEDFKGYPLRKDFPLAGNDDGV